MAKRATKKADTERVMVLVPNVWASGVKWFQYDVVEVSAGDAKLLTGNKQVKITKDDVTVNVDVEGNRAEA
jgi:hypothetical protein